MSCNNFFLFPKPDLGPGSSGPSYLPAGAMYIYKGRF